MMACHAVVQRILLETLGLAPIDPRTTPVGMVMQPPADLDMTPMFADDGFLAGRDSEVRRALQHIKPIMPALGLRFSMLEVVPAAGPNHAVDLAGFQALGCSLNETGNLEVLKSPIGDTSYCEEYCVDALERTLKAVRAVGTLRDSHVGLYLL